MAGPRWIRLDVDYFDNPKTLAAGRDGRDMHLASLCWVGRYLTDGRIPAGAVVKIAHDAGVSSRTVNRSVDRLTSSGLWLPEGGDYFLKDFVEMNGSRADVERERELYRQRQERYRKRRSRDA